MAIILDVKVGKTKSFYIGLQCVVSIIKWHLMGLQCVVSIITCHLKLQNRRFGLCKFFMNLAQNRIRVKNPTGLNVSCWHYWSIHHSLMSYFCTLGWWILSLNNLLKQVFMKIWSLRRWNLSYLSHATIWRISLVLIWMLAVAPAIAWVDVRNTWQHLCFIWVFQT